MADNDEIEKLAGQEYKYGFVTDVEADAIPPGLNEDIVRLISAKKNEPELLLEWRLKAYRHWLTMKEPTWAERPATRPIDYQDIIYYSAPKQKKTARRASTRSIPKSARRSRSSASRSRSRSVLAGVAVDAVFDSVSVATTFKEKLARAGHHLLLVLRGGAGASGAGAASTSARSCRTPTTSSPRSTPRSSATARSATSRRACAARWSCPPTSASTRRTPASSSAR